MREFLATVLVTVAIGPSIAFARSDEIPNLDVRPVCRGIASQTADPGIGQGGQGETFQRCIESEKEVREQIRKRWSDFSAGDKRHCVELAKTGGESSNTELLTCLEMSRDVRNLRSAAAATSATTKPASPLSTPNAVAAPAAPPVPSTPAAPPESAGRSSAMEKELDRAKGEVERAKADAQAAKTSEALAQRKLADAETALRRAREEVERAKAETVRATADADVARKSEATVKRQLADAEAARVAAEKKVCQSGDTEGQGLGGRLRRWLGRPSAPNP